MNIKIYYYNDTGGKELLKYDNNIWKIEKYYDRNIFYLIEIKITIH